MSRNSRTPRAPSGASALAAAGLALVLALPAEAYRLPARPGSAQRDPSFRDLESLLAASELPLVSSEVGDGVTLPDPQPGPLLDQLGADLPCGTVVADAARRALARVSGPRRAELETLLGAPRLAQPRVTPVNGESLVLVHDASSASRHAASRLDADRDQLPDAVEETIADARLALEHLRAHLGWDGRFANDADVRLVLAASAHAQGAAQGDGSLVIPVQLRGSARLAAVSHQLAHAALLSIEPDLPPAFVEAAATWIERSLLEHVEGEGDDSPFASSSHASRVLLSPGVLSAREDAAFLAWAGPHLGLPDGWLGEALAATSRRLDADRGQGAAVTRALARARLLGSLDAAFQSAGSSLADAAFGFMEWRLEQDLRLDGPRASVDEDLATLPAETTRDGGELPPFGLVRVGLPTPPVGGLRLALAADSRVRASVLALQDDGAVLVRPLGGGSEDVALPGGRLVRIVALVAAPEAPEDWRAWEADAGDSPGAFTLAARCDAAYPFLLASVSAAALPDQVTLEWATSSEEDVRGWLVERALRPGGPFARLSDVPMPAQSEPEAPASYAFVDTDVRASSRYHYRVVALTTSGLAEPSPVLTVRTLPEAMRRD